MQTPTEESERTQRTSANEAEAALKYPIRVSDAYEELDFSVANQSPDIYWDKLMKKLLVYAQKWARPSDGYDAYIQRYMEKKGPHCLGWGAFGAFMCDLYETAKLHAVQGSGVIQAAYTLMRVHRCEKMCNVMRLVLLEMQVLQLY